MWAAIVWTALNAGGALLVGWLLREAVLDRRAVAKADVVNGRRVVAEANVRGAAAKLAALCLFTAAGGFALVGMWLASAWMFHATRMALLMAAGVIVWDAWQDRRMIKTMWLGRFRR